MIVRRAEISDIPAIVEMGRKFYAQTEYADHAEYCCRSAEGLAELAINNGAVFLAIDADKPVGMVGVVVCPFLFNTAHKYADELFWWVDQEAQNRGAGKALLDAAEEFARESGCLGIRMMHLQSSPAQAGETYRKRGYIPCEYTFWRALKWD